MLADNGKKLSASDYRGKKVVLCLCPKDGTPRCVEKAIESRDIAKEFARKKGIILAVSKDSV